MIQLVKIGWFHNATWEVWEATRDYHHEAYGVFFKRGTFSYLLSDFPTHHMAKTFAEDLRSVESIEDLTEEASITSTCNCTTL